MSVDDVELRRIFAFGKNPELMESLHGMDSDVWTLIVRSIYYGYKLNSEEFRQIKFAICVVTAAHQKAGVGGGEK